MPQEEERMRKSSHQLKLFEQHMNWCQKSKNSLTKQGFFQLFIACSYRTQSLALFQYIFKFCTFLPKFSNILPFLTFSRHFFGLFVKNRTHTLTFQNTSCQETTNTCQLCNSLQESVLGKTFNLTTLKQYILKFLFYLDFQRRNHSRRPKPQLLMLF